MSGAELKRAKRRVRRSVLALRDRIPPAERDRLGRLVHRRVLALPELEDAGTVMAFWSFGSEVPTGPLIEALHGLGKRVALPRMEAGDVRPIAWRPGEPLRETSFGAFEPARGRGVSPDDVDLVLVPAVAFDRTGRRVGYGGGYYDRFLARTRPRAPRVGVGFAVQLLDEPLPGGPADLRVDVIVTDAETLRVARDA